MSSKKTQFALSKCATCGKDAVAGKAGKNNRLDSVQCSSKIDTHGYIAVIGPGRSAQLWNQLQERKAKPHRVTSFTIGKGGKQDKQVRHVSHAEAMAILARRKPEPPVQNKSGAKDSVFGRGDTEAEKDFAKNAKPVKKQSDVEIDRADDRKVIIPEWVEVIDSKFGCVIGFQPANKVFNLCQNDCRFRENITQDNVLQLFYNGEWAKNNYIEVTCNSLEEYANLIRRNIDTVTPCDDLLNLALQCAYDAQGRHFVANVGLAKIKDSLDFIDKKLRKLLAKNKTEGIITYFKKKSGK